MPQDHGLISALETLSKHYVRTIITVIIIVIVIITQPSTTYQAKDHYRIFPKISCSGKETWYLSADTQTAVWHLRSRLPSGWRLYRSQKMLPYWMRHRLHETICIRYVNQHGFFIFRHFTFAISIRNSLVCLLSVTFRARRKNLKSERVER